MNLQPKNRSYEIEVIKRDNFTYIPSILRSSLISLSTGYSSKVIFRPNSWCSSSFSLFCPFDKTFPILFQSNYILLSLFHIQLQY